MKVVYILMVIILFCGSTATAEHYPLMTVVVEKEYTDTDIIAICEDRTGNLWEFYDVDNDWYVGDIANLLMWNMNDDIEDDEIIEVYYEGHTDNLEMFYEINGWR